MSENLKSGLSRVITRCYGILLHPKTTWSLIASEPGGLKEAFVPFALVMNIIPAVMALSPGANFMFARFNGQDKIASIFFAGARAILFYIGSIVFIFVFGKWMEWIAPLFGAKKNWALSCRVLIYAATPVYVLTLLAIIPFVGMLLAVMAIPWTFVLFYMGVGQVLKTRGAGQLLYTLTAMVASIFIVGGAAMLFSPRQLSYDTLHAMKQTERPMDSRTSLNSMVDMEVAQAIAEGKIKPNQAAQAKAERLRDLELGQKAMEAAIRAQGAVPAGTDESDDRNKE